jgi:apolipoprotein N-acyltransferase
MTLTTSLLSLAAGAALFGLVTQIPIAPATWVALPLLLHASRSMPPGLGTLYLWIATYAAFVFGNRGMMPFGGAPYFGANAALATTLVLPFLVDRLLASRTGGLTSTLLFPMAFVAAEFLRSRFAPPATWNSLAYTQYGWLPLMQIAAFVGIWGISFLLGWTASTFEWAWSRNFEWSVVGGPVMTCAAVVGCIIFAGSIRVATAPTDGPAMRAVALNAPIDVFAPGEMTKIASGRVSPTERPALADKLARAQAWFLDGSRREARAGARLVAWPEQNLLVFAEDEPAFIARAQQLAAEEHVHLVMGLGTVHVGAALPFENKSVVIDPAGKVLAAYLKSRPVAGWEASVMRPGDGRLPMMEMPGGRLTTAICFDADFPELMRQTGQGGADLVVVPANEWRNIKHVHAQMAAFRAIENGVSLLRPAASGISSAVDPWGRVLGMSDHFSGGDRTLIAQVPIRHVATLYAKTGDLFAWLCVAGVLAAAAVRMWTDSIAR